MSETVTKTEFAELMGVTKGRVSQWLKASKIDGDALDGEGRNAKVNVEVAKRQLKERLDPNQKLGVNGLRPDRPADAPSDDGREDRPPTAETRIASEKLRQAQLTTTRLAREEGLAAWRYVRADDARRMIGESNARLMQAMEGGLQDMALAVAAEFGLSARAVRHVLKKAQREVRIRNATLFREVADKAPELVDDVANEPEVHGTA